MYILSFYRMNETPEAVKMRLRELTFGREYDSPMYAWTFNDGSCWAATLATSSGSPDSCRIVAWACLTKEVDHFPVVGVYTDPNHRRKGLGRIAAGHLLERVSLDQGTPVYAVAANWRSWPEILRNHGLVHFEWE